MSQKGVTGLTKLIVVSVAVSCPAMVEYFPVPHFVHSVRPVSSAYVPATHVWQTLLPAVPAYVPTLHREHALA